MSSNYLARRGVLVGDQSQIKGKRPLKQGLDQGTRIPGKEIRSLRLPVDIKENQVVVVRGQPLHQVFHHGIGNHRGVCDRLKGQDRIRVEFKLGCKTVVIE